MAFKYSKKASSVRASITFGPEPYSQIQKVSHEKRVSVAWVVRDAIVKYPGMDSSPKNRRAARPE